MSQDKFESKTFYLDYRKQIYAKVSKRLDHAILTFVNDFNNEILTESNLEAIQNLWKYSPLLVGSTTLG